jgi:hypothetical protein
MADLPVVEIDYDDAKQLADLASIYQDLTFCINTCNRLVELLEQNDGDHILVQSLWTSALVSYVRCFASGKRSGLSEQLFSHLEGEPVAAHQYYKNMRDKNVTHSVIHSSK